MNLVEIANIVCLIKSRACPENFNPGMNSPNKVNLKWILVQSKQTTVGDKNDVRKYYDIIE